MKTNVLEYLFCLPLLILLTCQVWQSLSLGDEKLISNDFSFIKLWGRLKHTSIKIQRLKNHNSKAENSPQSEGTNGEFNPPGIWG